MKATAIAPANIAFIKYWGNKNADLRLPENGSISMNLDNLSTTTTVEFSQDYKNDEIIIGGKNIFSSDARAIKHLNLVREIAGIKTFAKVTTTNNFPIATGLASSASGFAALSLAATVAAGLKLSEKELSVLARQGSGSASRSIPSGFVEWFAADESKDSYSVSLYSPDYWDILDVIPIISAEEKEISTTAGHKVAHSSVFYPSRLANIGNKLQKAKEYMADKNFAAFGGLVEAESLELFATMLTSTPSLVYWLPESIQMIKNVHKWRRDGLPVYFTEDAGPNLHLIIEGKNIDLLLNELNNIKGIEKIIVNKPSQGARLIN
jgi:diphosphomevalonate decarboxylase